MLSTGPAVELLKGLLRDRPELYSALIADNDGILLVQEDAPGEGAQESPSSAAASDAAKLALVGVAAYHRATEAVGITLEQVRVYTTKADAYFVVLVGPRDLPWGKYVVSL